MSGKKDVYEGGGTVVLRSNEDSVKHGLKTDVPQGQMYVIIFLGEKPDTSYWVKINDVREKGDAIHVDYTHGKGAVGGAMISYPYDDRIIPLSDKPVIFNDKTLQWKLAPNKGPKF